MFASLDSLHGVDTFLDIFFGFCGRLRFFLFSFFDFFNLNFFLGFDFLVRFSFGGFSSARHR